jgi:hypothetical protein
MNTIPTIVEPRRSDQPTIATARVPPLKKKKQFLFPSRAFAEPLASGAILLLLVSAHLGCFLVSSKVPDDIAHGLFVSVGVMQLVGVLALTFPTRVVLEKHGFSMRWLWRRTFVRYEDIRTVEALPYSFLFPFRVRLQLRSGDELTVTTRRRTLLPRYKGHEQLAAMLETRRVRALSPTSSCLR